MSEVQRLLIEENGETYEIYIETKTNPNLPDNLPEPIVETGGKRSGAKGINNKDVVKMQEARRMIRGYSLYALSAFRNFGEAEVEEVTLKFGLKLGGKAGIPYITEGSAESNLEIQVKCKFPPSTSQSSGATTNSSNY
ncbi:MAG: hypothetical protein F6J86_27835 [Symploca sp. SIO1B1]|nr:hypothetical protein [Symploca sp. SIO1B1]